MTDAEDEWPEGVRRMLADAQSRGIDVEIRARPAANSLPEAAKILGVEPRQIAKTLVVKRRGDSFLFALVPGDRQISWPKLRALVGVNKLSMPQPEVALEATGYERGTITPLGSSTAWPTYVDEHLAGTRVAMGAGGHGFSALLQVDQLVRALGAEIADISAPL